MIRLVLADTNALIAMLCFPVRSTPTLAAEVMAASLENELDLFIADVVAEELRAVVQRSFAPFEAALEPFLSQFVNITLPVPDEALLSHARAISVDSKDVQIATAAVQSAELYGVQYLLSNDFQNFHTPAMKAFLLEHDLIPISLYGLLKLLGRRL